jgi:ribosomal protein S13
MLTADETEQTLPTTTTPELVVEQPPPSSPQQQQQQEEEQVNEDDNDKQQQQQQLEEEQQQQLDKNIDTTKKYINFVVSDDDSSAISVALNHHMDLNEFLSINHIAGFGALFCGQVLKVKNPYYLPSLNQSVHNIPSPDDWLEIPTPLRAGMGDIYEDGSINSSESFSPSTSPGSKFIQMTRRISALTIPPNIKSRSRSMSDTSSKYFINGSSETPSPTNSPGTSPASDSLPRSLSEALERLNGSGRNKSSIVLRTPSVFKTEKGTVLSKEQMDCIHKSLPVRHYNKDWDLVYSSREHGISLATLFRNLEQLQTEETIFIVQTSKGQILGGYASEKWRSSPRYYGTGETFVFTFNPVESSDSDDEDEDIPDQTDPQLNEPLEENVPAVTTSDVIADTETSTVVTTPSTPATTNTSAANYRFYRSTRVNDYFQTSTERQLGFGGGASGSALQVDADFSYGISRKCITFNNDLLCEQIDDRFSIYCVELWSFHSLV